MRKFFAFGSECHYLDESTHSKLSPHGLKGYCLDINTRNHGYFILYKDRNKVVTTRNATISSFCHPSSLHELVEDSNHQSTYPSKLNQSSDEINEPKSYHSEPFTEQEHPNHENQSPVVDSPELESIAQSKPLVNTKCPRNFIIISLQHPSTTHRQSFLNYPSPMRRLSPPVTLKTRKHPCKRSGTC